MGKKSKKTTVTNSSSATAYGDTKTINPYVSSQTNNSGTTTVFNKDTAFDTINKFVNANMGNLLDSYLNPTLDTVTNQAKMSSFIDNLNANTTKNVENNIVNPLSNRNMIRSSQASNLYNSLAQNNSSAVADYSKELLANSQSETGDMLSRLLLAYMNGYSVLSDTQKQSLLASQGNATKNGTNTVTADDSSAMMQLAMQMAMLASSL